MSGRNIGYIRQQTVNADFIICSKTGNFQKLEANNIKVDAIESPTISQLIEQIDSFGTVNSQTVNSQTVNNHNSHVSWTC